MSNGTEAKPTYTPALARAIYKAYKALVAQGVVREIKEAKRA